MESIKIIDKTGLEKNVFSIFYSYDGMYYLIYTDKTIDEKDYVILHIVKVGKDLVNNIVEFIGVEITDETEWKNVQKTISLIVEDKKNKTTNKEIQYFSSNMLNAPVRIRSDKIFRLKREIIENSFGLNIEIQISKENEISNNNVESDDNIIVDYRTKFFEEQEKNKKLEEEILGLQKRIHQINEITNIQNNNL